MSNYAQQTPREITSLGLPGRYVTFTGPSNLGAGGTPTAIQNAAHICEQLRVLRKTSQIRELSGVGLPVVQFFTRMWTGPTDVTVTIRYRAPAHDPFGRGDDAESG